MLPAGARAGTAFVLGVLVAVLLWPGLPLLGDISAAVATGLAILLPALPRKGVVALVAIGLLGVARAELPVPDAQLPQREVAEVGAVVVAEGAAAADARPTAGGYTVLMDVRKLAAAAGPLPIGGRLLVRSRLGEPPGEGDALTVTGRLRLPGERPGFDRRAYLAQRGAWLEIVASQVGSTPGPARFTGLPAMIRASYRSALAEAVPRPHSAVLMGVVLGIRSGVPAALEQDLIATGLVHLLVLSGLKVAVFARLSAAALTPILGRAAIFPVLVLVILYALVGGATPAAVRAAAMGGIVLVGVRLGRPAHVWTSLALVGAAMLAWDPSLTMDVGFQLSFLGTAAIVLLTPPIERRLAWLPGIFREPLAVTLAAQFGTLPITASGFHLLSPVAPLANALTLPLLPALIVSGILLGPLAILPDLARAVAVPTVGLVVYLEQVAGVLARLPGAALPVPDPPAWLGYAYYAAALGGYGAWRTEGTRRRQAVGLALAIPLLIAAGELAAWARAAPTVTVLDVGEGQAVLAGGAGGWLLVDGGPTAQRLTDELGRRIPPWQRHLDALFITSPGAGHVGGLAGLQMGVDRVFVPRAGLAGEAGRAAALAASARGAKLERIGAGDVITIAGLTVQVLAPESSDPADQPGAGYLALRISRAGGGSFCDLSDLDQDSQMVAAGRLREPCSMLLLPAAGRSLPAPELIRAAGSPALVISAAAARPARGIPTPRLRRTDQEGPITIPL